MNLEGMIAQVVLDLGTQTRGNMKVFANGHLRLSCNSYRKGVLGNGEAVAVIWLRSR